MQLQLHRTLRVWKEPSKFLSKVMSHRFLTVWQFIDSLTQKTKWAVESLVPQNHAVRPFKLEGSVLVSTIILLDTPGFDGLFNSDVFEEVEKWLQSER